MEYGKIVSVTGLPGLFELVSSKNDGAIVRSLEDKSTKFVSSRIHNFSHLESIEIYTVRDNVNLVDVFQAIQQSKAAKPDGKDNGAVKKYFEEVYPDLDFERVYSSDMKKILKWFGILSASNIEIKLRELPEEETEEQETEPVEAPAKASAKKEKAAPAEVKAEEKEEKEEKAAKKEKAPAKATAKKEKAADAEEEEKPKKKAAPKAKKEEEEEKPAAKKKAAPAEKKPKK